jgi:diacylglycerol kinase (ATP)
VKRVAVIAHADKTLGGGLPELRRVLDQRGLREVFWREVPKSRLAAKQVRKALQRKVDVIFVWGGDGMVQRCVDVMAGGATPLAILPAGTGNLLAENLGIPKSIDDAVDIGLYGARRAIDVGRVNGERFAVMAGAGFDAEMMGEADAGLKDRIGRLAYVWTGAKNLRRKPFQARISVDGHRWYDGDASLVLLGNVGKLFGGVEAFDDARPDDGRLELGVVAADGALQWMETIARAVVGTASKSSHAHTTTARSVRIRLNKKIRYEIDGGDRPKVRKLRIDVEPAAIEICVPAGDAR